MIATIVGWLLSFIGPGILKRGALILIPLLLVSTGAAAYVAKQQYDKNIEGSIAFGALHESYKAQQLEKELADKLIKSRDRVIRTLRRDMQRTEVIINESPNDGCLDTRIPDDIARILRE